ncbi:hypothetical protein M422DRAFT_261985, partial [Sphaerobolus stellatus SS14]
MEGERPAPPSPTRLAPSSSPSMAAASVPLPPSPSSPQKTTLPSTHIPSIQPHSSFFSPLRPNQSSLQSSSAGHGPPSPTAASFVMNISAVSGDADSAPHGLSNGNRAHEAASQLSKTTSEVTVSTLAARRALKHSREPLLPIGVAPRPNAGTGSAVSSPTSPGTRVRGSLDRFFNKRVPASPSAKSMQQTNHSPKPSLSNAKYDPGEVELQIQTPRSPRLGT